MTAPGDEDAVRVVWGEGADARALTFESLDGDTWSRREWVKENGQWRIVGSETVASVTVENARRAAE